MKTRLMKLSAFCLGIAVALSLAACAGKTPSATPAPLTAAPAGTDAPATAEPTAEPTAAPTIQPGEILLLGEKHADEACLEKELERWGEFYARGDRHLFLEVAFYEADYLNQWMKESSNEILDRLFEHTEDEIHLFDNTNVRGFYMQIKKNFPETVFHGTDAGHTFAVSGYRYLKDLRAAGQENSEAYIRALEVMRQGQKCASLGHSAASETYREECMVQNFLWEYDKIAGENVMGIYGSFHTNLLGMVNSEVGCMAKQLAVRFGDALKSENLTLIDVINSGVMTVDGREYEVSYFGSENIAAWHPNYVKREYWRLENAYEDFASYPLTDEVLPYDNYPMGISKGQVFVIDYYKRDGTVEREYHRSDGTYWNSLPCTVRFSIDG